LNPAGNHAIRRRVVAGSLKYVTSRAATGALGIAASLYLYRGLGPAQAGHFQFAIATATTLGVVGGLGFFETLARFVPERGREEGAALYRRGLQLNLLFLVGLALVFLLLPHLPVKVPVEIRRASPLIFLSVASYAIITTSMGMLRGQGRLIALPRLDLVWNFGAKVAAVGMVLAFTGFLPAYAAHTTLQITATGIALLLLWKSLWGPVGRLRREEVRFCLLIFSWDVLRVLIQQVDIFVLRLLLEAHDVGIYAAGTRLIKVGEQLVLTPLMVPLLYYFSHPESSFMRSELVRHGTRLAGTLMGLAALLLAAFAEPIVTILLGNAYLESIPVARLYVCFGLGRGLTLLLIPLFNSLNRPEYGIAQGLVTFVLNLGLDLVLVPRYGPLGAAASGVIAITVAAIGSAWFVQTRLGIAMFLDVMKLYLLYAAAFAALELGHPWLGIAVYVAALVPLRLLRRKDLQWLRRSPRSPGGGGGPGA